MYLYHYFDKRSGPFKSLTALTPKRAEKMLEKINKERPGGFCAKRDANYLEVRRACERIVFTRFLSMGGQVDITSPYYMVVEECPWLATWYEEPAFIKIPIDELDTRKISFTYGDMMPTFNPRAKAGKPEGKLEVFTYDEILRVIDDLGLPQDWNSDGTHGYERYIEAHVWTDEPILKYIESNRI